MKLICLWKCMHCLIFAFCSCIFSWTQSRCSAMDQVPYFIFSLWTYFYELFFVVFQNREHNCYRISCCEKVIILFSFLRLSCLQCFFGLFKGIGSFSDRLHIWRLSAGFGWRTTSSTFRHVSFRICKACEKPWVSIYNVYM